MKFVKIPKNKNKSRGNARPESERLVDGVTKPGVTIDKNEQVGIRNG